MILVDPFRIPRRKISPLDVVLFLLAVTAAFFLVFRVKAVLNYEWNWGAILQYLLRYDPENKIYVPNLLLRGLLTTVKLSIWSTLLGLVMGTIIGLCRMSHSVFRQLIGRTYVELIRNLPPLVLVFIFYYFLSDQLLAFLRIDHFIESGSAPMRRVTSFLFAPPSLFGAFLSAVITLGLFEGAFMAEIIRAGILSVEKGQWEAAHALGLSRGQQLRHVILPQAIRRILPPLAGQFISTVKDSAIVSVISIQELTFQAMEVMSATYLTFEIWTTVAVLYLCLTLTLSVLLYRLERYLQTKGT
jgi:polar amino acid transport system permease protein